MRIAPTRPSIMSDGATISAPARACDSASRTSSSSVASLSTSLPSIAPQWPWSVYSHMQTSVITASPGHVLFDLANRALHLAIVVPRLAALRVLAFRNSKQDDRGNACGPRLARFRDDVVDRQLRDARHRRDRPSSRRVPRTRNRLDQIVGRQTRLANHPADGFGASQPARAVDWKGHRGLVDYTGRRNLTPNPFPGGKGNNSAQVCRFGLMCAS